MSVRIKNWKVAAVIALICTGGAAATVVGVKIYNWRVVDKVPNGGYLLLSEDGRNCTNIPEAWADSPEDALYVKEQLTLLEQQDRRKLVGVSEYEVNGQLDSRMFFHKYTLSDGRTIRRGKFEPDNAPRILVGERGEEASQRFGELLGEMEPSTYERVVQGQVFSFKSYQFTLSDGTEVVYSFGRLKDGE